MGFEGGGIAGGNEAVGFLVGKENGVVEAAWRVIVSFALAGE